MAIMKEIFGYLQRLKEGNEKYLTTNTAIVNVSPQIREKTARNGQSPYAVVITCSDSSVIPEAIFSAGIGKLFVIRTAGNTIEGTTLGSIEYAVEHLGVKLIVVLGHTHCGAIETVLCNHEEAHGNLGRIVNEISKAVAHEQDPYTAVKLNVEHGVKLFRKMNFQPLWLGLFIIRILAGLNF